MWSARWFTVDQSRNRLEELPADAMSRAIMGEIPVPFTQAHEAYAAMVMMAYRDDRYHETIVSLVPITDRIVDPARLAEHDDEMPIDFDLGQNASAYRDAARVTGVPIDDLCGTMFLGHSPLTKAALECLRVETAFAARYCDHGRP